MKSQPLFFTFSLALIFSISMAKANTIDDKRYVINYSSETENHLVSMLADVNEKAWNHRLVDGQWTIAETAEHLLAAEQIIFKNMKKILSTETADANRKSDLPNFEVLQERLLDRYSKKAKTVAPLEPSGKWATKKGFLEAFRDHRTALRSFLSNTDQPLEQFFTETPVGTINLMQYAVLASAHGARHTMQIEDIKAQLGLKTTAVSFGGRVKVNVPAGKREDVRAFFSEVLHLTVEKSERFDRIQFDGGGFVAMVYHTDESQILTEKEFANAMQVGLLVPAEQYESIRFRVKAYGMSMYQPPYKVDTRKNFYFHAPGGQIFRIIKQEILE
jgi:hypothetical protein